MQEAPPFIVSAWRGTGMTTPVPPWHLAVFQARYVADFTQVEDQSRTMTRPCLVMITLTW
ncbi:MAG: hypothetical protein KatS3mg111_0335 [Pirellulaceae bacterium]|nr:MAG: hypothetical protein KatS3mg111_0335 [Pirellulaceae bacterium]